MAIYLDNAATTQVCPEAAEAAIDAMRVHYGNPSSSHRMGREAAKLLQDARASLARSLDCAPEEFYFTSCGTESDNWAILRGAEYNARLGKHVLSSAVEHPAVLKCLERLEQQGFSVTRLSPRCDGSIAPDAVRAALREDTCLVTLMTVNNETGAITDIAEIARLVHAYKPEILMHTDAVQAFGKVPLHVPSLGADLISVSGHKIHAPKGTGGLYIRRGKNLPPLLLGGGQEKERRSGTEALPGILAFAAAAEAYRRDTEAPARIAGLRAHAEERLRTENPELQILCEGAPHILSLSLPGWRSETLMNYLESQEIYVSKSSACKRGRRSHVLEAMGLRSDVIDGALRVGLSRFTTEEEIDRFCDILCLARKTLRSSVRRR